VLGRPVKFQQLPIPIVRRVLGKEFYQMFRWFNQVIQKIIKSAEGLEKNGWKRDSVFRLR